MEKLKRKITKILNKAEFNQEPLVNELRTFIEKNEAHNHNQQVITTLGEYIKNANSNIEVVSGQIKTGFDALDNQFGAFNHSDLIVIGGRPNMGKTQFMINMALNMSNSYRLLYVTSDLSVRQLNLRFLATLTGITTENLIKMDLSGLMPEGNKFNHSNLYIAENTNINEILSLCRTKVKNNNIQVVFIDYLQLLNDSFLQKKQEHKLCKILNKLKQLAVELNICIVVSSQLSRRAEKRGFASYPNLSDLQDGGASEKLASKVLLLYRPEYYGFELDDEDNDTKGLVQLHVVKNKIGPEGKILLRRNDKFTSIDNV
jgi:replicative DNA helicase